MIKINNIELPSPSEYRADIMDLVGNSERNAKGRMFREYIATKYKITLSWGSLNQEELTHILNSIREMEFQVTFLDPITGSDKTATFYASDRGADLSLLKREQNVWKGLKVNLIEV